MPTIRIYFEGRSAGEQLRTNMGEASVRVRTAAQLATQNVRDDIYNRGLQDIETQGRLGEKYAPGFQVSVTQGGGNIRVGVSNNVPGFGFLNQGGTATGDPYMWIPTSFSGIHNVDAKDYLGRLFRVKRKNGGTPLLMDAADRQVKYVGVSTVNIKKKFRTIEIVQQVASKLPEYYAAQFTALK